MESNPTTIAPQRKNETGHREARSVVGVQLNCAFPARFSLLGKSGEGRTILPASRMRLSQKISRALFPGSGAGRGALAARLPSPAGWAGNSLAVPRFGLLTFAASATIPI